MDTPDVVKVAVEAVRQGYAIVPVRPGTKRPDICTLTARELTRAGKYHKCGLHHAITDDKLARRVFSRLVAEFAPHRLNLGVVAYPSRLIVVDCDTAAAVQAFREDWAAAAGDGGYLSHTPTVRTPGMVDDGGEWIHKDGGHFIFHLPDGTELELGPGALKLHGYDIRWGWSMSVVPPSERSEGRYTPSGNVIEAPAWLLEQITERLQASADRLALHDAMFGNDAVARWSQAVSWADLLVPDGWEETGKLDGCGCPVFTRPGEPSTYRSATGHEAWCERWENNEDHGPLHFWTDNPPDALAAWMTDHGRTVTKLTYVALTHHKGDVAAAKVALGIDPDPAWLGDGIRGRESAPEASVPVPSPLGVGVRGRDDSEAPSPPRTKINGDGGFWTPDENEDVRSAILREASKLQIRQRAEQYLAYRSAGVVHRAEPTPFEKLDVTPVTPGVAYTAPDEQTGLCIPLLYPGKVSTIWGPSESGKSWFGLACAIDVVQRGGRALIVDLEDSPAGWRSRVDGLDGVVDLTRLTYLQPTALDDVERAIIRDAALQSALVVVDSFDELLALMRLDSSNNATAVRTTGALLRSWARSGAVLVVDHSTDKAVEGPSTTAMGSSAKKQLIDGAMLRADRLTEWAPKKECRTMIMLGKDRHGGLKPHTERDPESRDPRAFSRLALLKLTESLDGGVLRLLKPPSYAAEGETSNETIFDIQGRMLEYLRHEVAGQWRSQSQVYGAAGDRNGRKGQPAALSGLVDMQLVEEEITDAKAGARLITKRYRLRPDPDRPSSPTLGNGDGDGPNDDNGE